MSLQGRFCHRALYLPFKIVDDFRFDEHHFTSRPVHTRFNLLFSRDLTSGRNAQPCSNYGARNLAKRSSFNSKKVRGTVFCSTKAFFVATRSWTLNQFLLVVILVRRSSGNHLCTHFKNEVVTNRNIIDPGWGTTINMKKRLDRLICGVSHLVPT